MGATKHDVDVTRAFAILRALDEGCLNKIKIGDVGVHNDREGAEQSLLQLLAARDEWLREVFDWCDTFAMVADLPAAQRPEATVNRFIARATIAQKEAVLDRVIPIYIESLRRPWAVPCQAMMMTKWEQAQKALVSAGIYEKSAVQRDYTAAWQSAARRASIVGGGLKKAQMRAAERTYAPRKPGARAASASFHNARNKLTRR